MHKVIIGIFVSMLLLATILPTTGIMNVSKINFENFNEASTDVDWWPMFHHDLQHTGFSTSDAPETNKKLWDSETSNKVSSSPAVVDNKVYIGSYDNNVYCINAVYGDKKWMFTTGDVIESSPTVYDDKIYVGSNDNKVYCLDAEGNGDGTTTEIWNYTTSDPVHYSPIVFDGHVYILSGEGYVYCLDADDGSEIWSFQIGGAVWSSSSPAVAEDRVYVGSLNGIVYCLQKWTFATSGAIYSSPAVVDDRIYIGSDDMKVYCLDAEGNGDGTTTEIWNYTTGGEVRSSPAAVDGKVYIGSSDEKVYCLDATDGSLIWSHTTGGFVTSSPSVADGKVYVGSDDNNIYCLDAEGNGDGTTTEIWNYTTCDIVHSSPAIADGKVFIGSNDGYVYCFRDNEPPNAPDITGPSSGTVGEEYEYTIITTDPDEDDVSYEIDWDDGESQYSVFLPSGTEITRNHTWSERGTYTIRVRARDLYYGESNWSEQIMHIGVPELKIEITGGFGVHVVIRNVGDGDAYDVEWNLDITGGILGRINFSTEGYVSILLSDGEIVVDIPLIIGFGPIEIAVAADASNGEAVSEVKNGFIILFFVILR